MSKDVLITVFSCVIACGGYLFGVWRGYKYGYLMAKVKYYKETNNGTTQG